MTAGWTGTDMAAGDVAWRAWGRIGLSPMQVAFKDGGVPPLLEPLMASFGDELERLTRAVLDEAEVRLYGEARERVVAAANLAMVHHTAWAIVDAVRQELMRPEPVAYAPPPAGSWIRTRRPDRNGSGPRWAGRWHTFSGDVTLARYGINERYGRGRCGARVLLRSELLGDAAIAETMPGVDACGRCRRIVAA